MGTWPCPSPQSALELKEEPGLPADVSWALLSPDTLPKVSDLALPRGQAEGVVCCWLSSVEKDVFFFNRESHGQAALVKLQGAWDTWQEGFLHLRLKLAVRGLQVVFLESLDLELSRNIGVLGKLRHHGSNPYSFYS